jgi:SAM-dependent methyltransferase
MSAARELLLENATRTWNLSRESCRVDPASGRIRRWHHGLWPWLRLMNLNTSPARFAEFYGPALARALEGAEAKRILLSGAADFEMLAQVANACGARAASVHFALIDLCETSLAQGRWYAERSGLELTTRRSDILEFESEQPFDAICSDSFLGQFSPAARERLIARWARLLRSGGRVITVNRLRPDADPERRVGFSAEQASAFVASVEAAARTLPQAARPEPAELADCAARYAARQGAWPVRSAAEVEALFARGGFEVTQLEAAPIAGALAGPTAPTLAGGSLYVRVVAKRH